MMSDDSSCSSDSTSSFPDNSHSPTRDSAANEDKEQERNTLAYKENKAVVWSRFVVVIVLVVTAALVSISTYILTKNDQIEDFERAYDAYAIKVTESFNAAVIRKLEAVDALSVTFTSYAKSTNASWPNVTLPDYEIRSGNSRILSESVVINYSPIVTDETREGWGSYANLMQGQIQESVASDAYQRGNQDLKFGRTDRQLQGDEQFSPLYNFNILDGTNMDPEPGSGPYLPTWQTSPPVSGVTNFNVLSHPSGAPSYKRIIETGKAVMGMADIQDESTAGYLTALLSLSQFRYDDFADLALDPITTLGYPVFDTFLHESRKPVGVLGTNLIWRLVFQKILPPNARGIVCVLSNSQGQKLTYGIDGEYASFLGVGDLHNSDYDHLMHSVDLSQHVATIKSPKTQSYTSTELDTSFNDYKLEVYPSIYTESEFVDNKPLRFTLLVLGTFAFTSLVFVTYDYFVARRQRVVMNRAVNSSAIVSSLFPSQVRDQIYKENECSDPSKKDRSVLPDLGERNEESSKTKARPIAQNFEDTTILFADLAGFTKWSSSRTPVAVFELLECLYGAFDRVAKRRSVFKVETIGDCYVAVAGVPEAQEDHVLIMSKFARDILSKSRQCLTMLAETLGEDTASLELRVGMHSGNVTGGVLRGQKSRFQLFGDSMNTASRMESNGQGGRIHVSQSTADKLVAIGRECWIVPREDKIMAKGKGEMQTYWVTPRDYVTSTISSNTYGTDSSGDQCSDMTKKP